MKLWDLFRRRCTLWILLVFSNAAIADNIQIVTEHLPPYQFVGQDNHLTGISVDIVKALLQQAKVEAPMTLLPWPEAYDKALSEKNVMIFSMARSKQRQAQFKWVGDFITQNYYFMRLKGRTDIQVNNVQDAKRYMTGVSKDSFEHQLLNRYGFAEHKSLLVDETQLPLVKMLYLGKIDLLFGSKITLLGLINYHGKDTSAIELVYQINESPGHIAIAFSRQTDDKVVKKFQRAFQRLQKNGEVDAILQKWLSRLALNE